MDDDVRGAGAFHDIARAGAFLWGLGPGKKRAVRAGAMSRHSGARYHPLVGW